MVDQQDNFGGAGHADDAAGHPEPIQQPQVDHRAAADRAWAGLRARMIEVARGGGFVLMAFPGDNRHRGPRQPIQQIHTEEQ